MALYLVRARYTSAAFQGMLAAPHDRGEAAKVLFKALGIKTHEILFSISSGCIVCLLEASVEQMAEAQMITMASGGFSEISAEEMISTKTMTAAMTSAGAKAAKYKAPNKK
jgi:uncharacterized protein with GYD domain